MTPWKLARPALWASFRVASRLYLRLYKREYRFVFILGHMRSGSSLLAHILASHRNIAGAGEAHISYQTVEDLPRLVFKTCDLLHRPILRQAYIVDQINHPYVSDDVLSSKLVYRCIILIREPEATIKSTMSMLKCSERVALEVYQKRLSELAHYGVVLGNRALLVQYDDLVDRSDQTLAQLTRYLGLASPLTPTYAIHRMTGQIEGYGDPSHNIKAGKIIRTAHHAIALSSDALPTATRAYDICQLELRMASVQGVNTAPPFVERSTNSAESRR